MHFLIILITLFSVPTFAQNRDAQLQEYIKKFQLKPLSEPEGRNPDLFKLGRFLFMSNALSGNNNISCAHCHHPMTMTNDFLPLALGEGAQGLEIEGKRRMQGKGKVIPRNTPALFNLAKVNVMFWDGRISFNPEENKFTTPVTLKEEVLKTLKSALAAQAIFPIVNHEEMLGQIGSNSISIAKNENEAWELIVEKLLTIPQFKVAFSAAFPGEKINIGHVGEALAHFQSHAFHFSDTPYDRYLKGDLTALSEKQKFGMEVFFNKGKCGECHNGEHLSNFEFHNVATPQIGPGKIENDDLGRYEWNQSPEDLHAFRVPPLRNVAVSAPYMHDGAYENLDAVVEHYDDITEGLRKYDLVKEWGNYFEKLSNHDHGKDEERLSNLSSKLSNRLEFEENEEEALIEFLRYGLTDTRLIKAQDRL